MNFSSSLAPGAPVTGESYLDALLAVPRLGPSAMSPDGDWIAWTWFGSGAAADVFVAPTDGSAEPLQLTHSDEESFLISWAPDSHSVVVGQDTGGDERVQLFRIDRRGGEMQPLTEPSPPYFLHGGQIHPDGRRLFYAMNYDVASGQEIEATWVYRHDLETGERVPIACPEKAGYMSPSLNDAGTHLLYERRDLDPSGNQVWLVDVDGHEDREILNVGAAAKVEAGWFPDSRRAVVVAESGQYRRLGVWDMEGGQVRWLVDDPARNIELAFAPRGSDRDLIVLVEIREAQLHASLLDLDSGEETRLPSPPGSFLPYRPMPDGSWIARSYHSTQPADLLRVPPGAPDAAVSLTRIWDRVPVERHRLVPAETVHWQSGDGMRIQGWLYRAAETARGTVVLVHGGPTSHAEDAFNAEVQFLVGEGFNVLLPNYRGSTGFSLAFQESIKEDGWGGQEQEDIRAGIEALVEMGVAQPGRIGITGTSYGGYSSWWAITHFPPEVVAAAAPICGMTDLVVDYETTRPDLRPYSEEMLGGTPEQAPERYRERSPIHAVDRIKGKLLIVQGMRDPNVTTENVRTVREALDRAGVPYEVLAFEDEGHGIMRPANQRVLYRRLAQFFASAFESNGGATGDA